MNMQENVRNERCRKMNTDRLVRTFQELVSIDSPSFDERRMADELAGRLKELGFAGFGRRGWRILWRDGRKSLRVPGGNPAREPLLFSTHMDTVEPARGKRAVLRGDGRIESGGDTVLGADCMAGTAALLEALAELKEEGKDCRSLELLFFIGEERHLQGRRGLDFSRVRAKGILYPGSKRPSGEGGRTRHRRWWISGSPCMERRPTQASRRRRASMPSRLLPGRWRAWNWEEWGRI